MKELLLAKSNLRKGKGLAIGLILLILMASFFLNIVLYIFLDFQNDPYRHAKRLNTEESLISIYGENRDKIDKNYIYSKIDENDINDMEAEDCIATYTELKYGEGTVSTFVMIDTYERIMSSKIGKSEIVTEDKSITKDYIYLPYQLHTGGKINLGDMYDLEILDKTYTLKVKGFLNNIVSGSYNAGNVLVGVSKDIYDRIDADSNNSLQCRNIKFDLKDNVNQEKFINKLAHSILEDYPQLATNVTYLEISIFSRIFVGIIIGVSLLVVCMIIITIVLLMISNSISNYIKDNIKILGAIKAIGYTSRDIKLSFIIQFLILSVIGNVLGITLSYLVLPYIIEILISQSGIPFDIVFNFKCTVLTVMSLISVIAVTVMSFIRKIKKIEPITALRDGIETHSFKKNKVLLEKTWLPLNIALALKTMYTNMKQNIATFVITFFLIFSAVVGLVMYQNFSKEPKLEVLTIELCNGAVVATEDSDHEIYNYINSIDGIKNTRLFGSMPIYNGDARIMTYIVDDMTKMRNKDACYEGRLPKYDNEIAISGKYAKSYNYKIGEEIEMYNGDKKAKYLITGFIQTTNNNGQEAIMLEEGTNKVIGAETEKTYFFDVEDGVDVNKCLDMVKEKYNEKIMSVINFDDVIKGSMGVFITISNLMAITMLIMCAVVILIVLYLLMKTLINNKKKDYGILKAIGYTSKNIVLQNAISYMPSIIFSTVVSSIISCFIVNPYIATIMNLFGIMKLNFTIPVDLVIYTGIGFVVVSFVFAILLSLRIRKIKPYELITGE